MAENPKVNLALVNNLPDGELEQGTIYMSPDTSGNFIKVAITDSSAVTIFDGSKYYIKSESDTKYVWDSSSPWEPGRGIGSAQLKGSIADASGNYSVAEGLNTLASGNYSHVEGESAVASGTGSHAEGDTTKASGNYSHAEGYDTSAYGQYSHAEGYRTDASGYSSHAEGINTTASGDYSHAEGDRTIASGYASHAEGDNTTASGEGSHAEGNQVSASGYASHAEGSLTRAKGDYSHAEGYYTDASGNYSHAEGNLTRALGHYSHAEGFDTSATGSHSHAEGSKTKANGQYSHAEGDNTTASSSYSHAEGYKTNASGDYSHAEGANTVASGNYSHAEGTTTTASGNYSHAEGDSTRALGWHSHAEGDNTTASGNYSHAEGYRTSTTNQYEHAQGLYNISRSNTLFSIGNGYDDPDPDPGEDSQIYRNALEIMQNGDAYLYGVASFDGQTIGSQKTLQFFLDVNPISDPEYDTIFGDEVPIDFDTITRLHLYIDDYPINKISEMVEDVGADTIEDFYDIVYDANVNGNSQYAVSAVYANEYVYEDTVEIDGTTYYLWYNSDNEMYAIMRTNMSMNYLDSIAKCNNSNSHVSPFVAIVTEDLEVRYDDTTSNNVNVGYQLACYKIDEE